MTIKKLSKEAQEAMDKLTAYNSLSKEQQEKIDKLVADKLALEELRSRSASPANQKKK